MLANQEAADPVPLLITLGFRALAVVVVGPGLLPWSVNERPTMVFSCAGCRLQLPLFCFKGGARGEHPWVRLGPRQDSTGCGFLPQDFRSSILKQNCSATPNGVLYRVPHRSRKEVELCADLLEHGKYVKRRSMLFPGLEMVKAKIGRVGPPKTAMQILYTRAPLVWKFPQAAECQVAYIPSTLIPIK